MKGRGIRLLGALLLLSALAEAAAARWISGTWLAGGLWLMVAALVGLLRLIWGPGGLVFALGSVGALAVAWLAPELRDESGEMVNAIPTSLGLALGMHGLAWARLCSFREENGLLWSARLGMLGGLAAAHGAFLGLVYAYPLVWVHAAGLTALGAGLAGWWWAEGIGGSPAARRVEARWILGSEVGAKPLLMATMFASLVLLWLVFPGAERLAGRTSAWLSGEATSSLEDYNNRQRRPVQGSAGKEGAGERELPKKLALEPGDSIRLGLRFASEADYAAAVAKPLYLRAWSLTEILGDSVLGPSRVGEWRFDSDDGLADGWVSLSERAATTRLDLFLPRREFTALPLPTLTQQLGTETVYEYGADWYQLLPEETVDRVRLPVGAQFPSPMLEALPSLQVRLATGPAVPPPLLPESALMGRLRDLGREAMPESGALPARLEGLKRWLHQRCRYSLRYDNPSGLPPLENFLQAERAGHCELFAAAALVLLQGQGVPARIAYGYCGGEGDPSTRSVVFRDRDFHSWVEIPLEGVGWAIYDVTPPGHGARHRVAPMPSSAQGTRGSGEEGWRWDDFRELQAKGLTLPATSGVELSWRERAIGWLRQAGWWPFVVAGLLALLAMPGLLSRARARLRRRKRDSHEEMDAAEGAVPFWLVGRWGDRPDPAGEAARLRKGLLDYCRRQEGLVKPAGETLREFIDRVTVDRAERDLFAQIVGYLYRIQFAKGPRDLALEAKWSEQIKGTATSPT